MKTFKEKRYEEERITEIIDEIDVTCDDLRMRGMDLNKITFSPGSYTKDQRAWMAEFDVVRKRLLRSDLDLSRIEIVERSK